MMNVSQMCLIQDTNIRFETINALVQRKRQIRINISTPNTSHLHSNNPQNNLNPQSPSQPAAIQQDKLQETIVQTLPIKQVHFYPKNAISSKPNGDLYEVIYRQNSKMASIGWFQQTPTKRNSNMSRTFRRRRPSNLQDYSTLNNSSLFYIEQSAKKDMKNSQIRVNNLELSGFTNEQIVKKASTSGLSFSNKNNNKQLMKYPKILTFIGDKIKRVEFILPKESSEKGVFSLNNHKNKNKWKYIPNNPQTNKNRSLKVEQKSFQGSSKKNELLYQHPFLKKIQSQKQQTIKPFRQKRVKSQFMHSRPRILIQTHRQYQQKLTLQQICRPWSVKRNNMEQKMDEGQQPKITLEQKIQQQ